jgi:ubiquinone/menaquinone biosynthesis C-methylase UbiE
VEDMSTKEKKLSQAAMPRGISGWIMGWIMPIFHDSIYKLVSPVLDLGTQDDLLDVGCGSGHFLKKYASHVKSIAGLDLSEVMIKVANIKNKGRIAAGTAEFVQGDAVKLPWDDSTFSAVTSMGSFVGFPKTLESIKEMYRVLRPGGRAVISIEWNAEDGVDHSKMVKEWGINLFSEEDMRSMMSKAGFSDISFSYVKGWGIPKVMIVRAIK